MTPDERGQRAVDRATEPSPSDWDAMSLAELIALEIREAVEAEREACAKKLCIGCEKSEPLDGNLFHDAGPEWKKDCRTMRYYECRAAAIRARETSR